ncbi:MAG TPA: 50S ribosomal protein L24 [Pseudomonadales bacterium]|jgi:large subunit ribosomal protein L24|nr:50S ribosomal protein L24 [Pseudomonadales bacterium]
MRKIKSKDEVIVITGRDKGRRGEVLSVRPDGRLVVAGVNVAKKHTRGNPNAGQPGGIIDKEIPIQASNVAIYNGETGKADRVGFRVEDGKKVRYFKSTKKTIDA